MAAQEPTLKVHAVVAGVLRRRGRVLVAHRSPQRRWYPDTWDLPGGHLLDGEARDQALARELSEELGISAEVTGTPFATVQGADFRMDVWVIDRWSGEPSNEEPAEHDALAWMTEWELDGVRLADPRYYQLLHAALSRA